MILNQADNVRQKFLILRFCFDWFKNRQRFQLLFHLCCRNLFFLYGDDRDIQANGSSFSFVRGDSVDVTAMKFRISLDQIKSDTCTFLIAGMWRLEKSAGRYMEYLVAGFRFLYLKHRYPTIPFLHDRKETDGRFRHPG